MKLCALVLLLTALAPLSAAGLTDAEVLAKLDDASASEARWILNTDLFATGAIGFDGRMPRAAYAFERLVRQGNATVFETLTDSNNDAAAAFGIEGLQQLDPKRLPALLEKMVLRRAPFDAASGCISSRDCLASMLIDAIEEMQRDRTVTGKAWLALARDIASSGGSPFDEHIACTLKKWITELPAITPEPRGWRYVQALLAPDTEVQLRKILQEEPESVSAGLALDNLSDRQAPKVVSDVFVSIWRRRALTNEGQVDLRIHAAYWDRKAARLVSGMAADRWVTLCEETEWSALTTQDWEWLASSTDKYVKAAAARLRAILLTGWRLDTPLPQDALQQKIWMLLAVRACMHEGSLNSRRARLLVLDTLNAAVVKAPVPRAKIGDKTVEHCLAELFETLTLLDIAESALAMRDVSSNLFGAQLLCVLAVAINQTMAKIDERHAAQDAIKKLWGACEAGQDDRVWDLRVLTLCIVDAVTNELEYRESEARVRANEWGLELARVMTSNARRMPVATPQHDFDAHGLQSYVGERLAGLLGGIYTGDNEFLPDDEIPKRPDAPKSPDAAEIFRRMQEAVAKLEK